MSLFLSRKEKSKDWFFPALLPSVDDCSKAELNLTLAFQLERPFWKWKWFSIRFERVWFTHFCLCATLMTLLFRFWFLGKASIPSIALLRKLLYAYILGRWHIDRGRRSFGLWYNIIYIHIYLHYHVFFLSPDLSYLPANLQRQSEKFFCLFSVISRPSAKGPSFLPFILSLRISSCSNGKSA